MMKKEKMCLLGLLPALTVPMTLPCLAGNNAELPPNIIVVLTDDMGYGDIGIYGVNLYLLPILTVWQKKVHGSINIIVHLLSVLLRVVAF